MILARVDDHVIGGRHVAGGALRAGRALRMAAMGLRIEDIRRMALAADRVAGKAKLAGMGIMAVRAGDARGVHPALAERGEIIDFVALLAVRVIEARRERRGMEGVVIMQDVAG